MRIENINLFNLMKSHMVKHIIIIQIILSYIMYCIANNLHMLTHMRLRIHIYNNFFVDSHTFEDLIKNCIELGKNC